MDHITYRIEDIAQVCAGGDCPSVYSEYQTEETPIPIYSNGLDREGLYGYTNTARIEGDSITVSARGVNIGVAFYRPIPFFPIVRLISIVPKRKVVDAKYLYYYLKGVKIEGTGSAQPQIPVPFFKKKKVILHKDINTQKVIANNLSTYDNLIENNNRRIRLLEQMAENLYKEWFVRLRFPGHEKAEFENGLPKGWNIGKLSSEFITSSGGTPSRNNSSYYLGNIPWIKTGELLGGYILETEEYITEEAVKNSSAKIIPPYSLLVAMYAGANVGNLGINTMIAACNQACCVIRSKGNYSLNYLKFFLQTQKAFLQSISFGAAQQNISQDIIKKLKVLFPSKALCDQFDSVISPQLKEIEFLLRQNKLLVKQRDLLLPRLMSGKLEVKV